MTKSATRRLLQCIPDPAAGIRLAMFVKHASKLAQLRHGEAHVEADADVRLQLRIHAGQGRQRTDCGELTALPVQVVAGKDVTEEMSLQELIDRWREIEQRSL